ncbi:MAG: hypothetical protein HDR06_15975 [Lachnospiraceae bacterium]|nr:hypothetical protein [Lachnospiraceae bacterium]
MSDKENNTTVLEENKMSLSESLDNMKKLRNFCHALDLPQYVTALDTVYEWVDKMVTFFYSVSK